MLAAKQLPQFIEEGKLGEYFDSPKDRSKQDTIKGFYPIFFNLKTPTDTRKAEILIAKDNNGKLFFDMFLDYDRDKAQLKRALNGNLNPVALTNIITDNSKNFNPDITNHEVHNQKENEMALLEEIKALIARVENGKEEDPKKDEEKDEKSVDNADVDKHQILREADAIAMKPASEFKGGEEEKFRTLTKKLEQLSYNKSSRGTADNAEPQKDDTAYEELKKEVKKDVENRNKCDNGVDNSKFDYFAKMNEVYSASMKMPEKSEYVSSADRLKAAEEYFGK